MFATLKAPGTGAGARGFGLSRVFHYHLCHHTHCPLHFLRDEARCDRYLGSPGQPQGLSYSWHVLDVFNVHYEVCWPSP